MSMHPAMMGKRMASLSIRPWVMRSSSSPPPRLFLPEPGLRGFSGPADGGRRREAWAAT